MQLGQTQYYVTYTNGSPSYQALAYAGNDPQGYTPISKDQYIAGLKDMISRYPNENAPGSASNTQDNISRLAQAQNKTGIYADNYLDPTLSKFAGATPNEQGGYKPGQDPNAANEAAVAAGTMKKIPIGNGYGYIPVGSAADAPQQNQPIAQDPLAAIYAKRPDLQAAYNPDGSKKNPNDGNPESLQAWAAKFGVNEEPSLKGYNPSSFGSASDLGPSSGAVDSGSIPGASSGFPSTGHPELDALVARLDKMIQDQAAAGNKFNPNIELTPDVIQKFLDQATSEVEPYYAGQIKAIKDDVSKNVDYLSKQYDLQKQTREADFKNSLRAKREDLAGNGLAFSGVRGQQENALVDTANVNNETAALAATNAARQAVSGAESKVGSRNLSDLGFPGISSYSASASGNGSFAPGSNLTYTNPSGGVTGSLEYSQRGDIRALEDFLKDQEVKKRALSFAG